MEKSARHEDDQDEASLSLVRGDAPFRLQRTIGLIPSHGFGVGRRAILLAAITWLPIAVWAAINGRALPGEVAEPLLKHFGVHIRCLIGIPLLVLAEAQFHTVTRRIGPYFLRSGIVKEKDHASFLEIVRGVVKLRNSTLPWISIVVMVLAWTVAHPIERDVHEVLWATEGEPAQALGFGGWWFVYVARPLYLALLVGWGWRVILTCVLLRRISRLDLSIVPTHPDRTGGLGFLEGLPAAFSLVILASSAVVASRWAHELAFHAATVESLQLVALAFIVMLLVFFLSPLLLFLPVLVATKRFALLDYGALVGEQGRLVGRRWISGEKVDDADLLSAPEIGPVADAITLYGAVESMRAAPIGKRALIAILLPALLPMLVAASIQIPIKSMLLKILSTLA